jgi:hypothetical protein
MGKHRQRIIKNMVKIFFCKTTPIHPKCSPQFDLSDIADHEIFPKNKNSPKKSSQIRIHSLPKT